MFSKNISKICYFLILIVFVVSFSSTLQSVFSASGNWSNNVSSSNKPSVGTGVSSNPYIITNGKQLYYWISNQKSTTKTYAKLGCDIDLASHYWNPPTKDKYSYELDGNGFSVNNLIANNTSLYNGLFGWVKDLTVKNLTVNCDITTSKDAGAIAGCVAGTLKIEKCAAKGKITANGNITIGGLVGYAASTCTFTNCFSDVDLNKGAYVGGVLGMAETTATFTLCENEGQISNSIYSFCGGIVGYLKSTVTINKCFNVATISCSHSSAHAGGLIGYATSTATIKNSFNTANISSTNNYAGGLCAYAKASCNIENCYNTGTITAAKGGVEYESITDETVDIIQEYSNYSDDVYYVEEYESGGDSGDSSGGDTSDPGTSEPDFGDGGSGSESEGIKMKYKDIKILKSLKNIGLCGYGNATITNSMSTLNTPSSYNYLSGNASVVLADGTTYEYGDFSIDNNLKLTGGSPVGDLTMAGAPDYLGTGNVIYGKEGTYLGMNWISGYPVAYSAFYYYTLMGFAFGLDYYEDDEYKTVSVFYGTYAEEEYSQEGAGPGAYTNDKRNCVLMQFFYEVSLEEPDHSTKEEIKETKFGTAYTTDPNINNGYPFIKDFYWNFS